MSGEKAGEMQGAYGVGRAVIIDWMNDFLTVSLETISCKCSIDILTSFLCLLAWIDKTWAVFNWGSLLSDFRCHPPWYYQALKSQVEHQVRLWIRRKFQGSPIRLRQDRSHQAHSSKYWLHFFALIVFFQSLINWWKQRAISSFANGSRGTSNSIITLRLPIMLPSREKERNSIISWIVDSKDRRRLSRNRPVQDLLRKLQWNSRRRIRDPLNQASPKAEEPLARRLPKDLRMDRHLQKRILPLQKKVRNKKRRLTNNL